MTDEGGERFAGPERDRGARRRRSSPRSRRSGALRGARAAHARRPLLAPLGRADRAADLAAVVHAHGPSSRRRRSPRCATGACASTPSAGRASTSSGWRTSGPWCISRQLWWGHRLPVYYCDACEETYVAREPPERCGACGGPLRQDEDVLDTWFSSALWPFATLGWPEQTDALRAFYPTDVLVTARDIIFLWVARMIMMGLEFTGEVPFADVVRALRDPGARRAADVEVAGHRDRPARGDRPQRRRRGALRAARDVLHAGRPLQRREGAPGRGAREQALQRGALRDPLAIGEGGRAGRRSRPRVEDRWILSRLAAAEEEIATRIERYDFARAAQALYEFVYGELCDWYIELVKARLADAAAAQRRCASCCGARCCSRTRSCRSSPRSSGRTCARTGRGCWRARCASRCPRTRATRRPRRRWSA